MKLFTFIELGQKHITFHFCPYFAQLPLGIKEGDSAEVEIWGEYEDKDVKCLLCRVGTLKNQFANGNL